MSNRRDFGKLAFAGVPSSAFALSEYFMADVDAGHMTAANFNPIAFVEENHARENCIHLKDRKKSQGQNQAWGQGNTPIKEVLRIAKMNKYRIPWYIELEYGVPESSTTVAACKKCFAYMRQALARVNRFTDGNYDTSN